MDRITITNKCIEIIDQNFYFMDDSIREKWEINKNKLFYEVEKAETDYMALKHIEKYLIKLSDPHTKLLFREVHDYVLPHNLLFNKGKLYMESNKELKEIYSINGSLVKTLLIRYKQIYKGYPLVLLEEKILKNLQFLEGEFSGESLIIAFSDTDNEEIILQPVPMNEWLYKLKNVMKSQPIHTVNVKRVGIDCIGIQITTFRDKDVMSKILKGLSNIKGKYNTIIFDVRNNIGGYVDTTKDVVSSIVREYINLDYKIARKFHGKIIYDSNIIAAKQIKEFRDKSIIVFVNYRTMSSAEYVFTKAIQLSGGLIVGEKTAGLKDQAMVVPINETVTLQVTTKRYIRNKKYLNGGIKPDVCIEYKINSYEKDSYFTWFSNQYERAKNRQVGAIQGEQDVQKQARTKS